MVSEVLEFTDRQGLCVARLKLYAVDSSSIVRVDGSNLEAAGEEALQLLEGTRVEFEFDSPNWRLGAAFGESTRLIETSQVDGRGHSGFLSTGLYTGRLELTANDSQSDCKGVAALEVRSRKLNYRQDYREMLEDITEHCMDLLIDSRAPNTFRVLPDPGNSPRTIAQRFAFLKALLGSLPFQNALHQITSHPHQHWGTEEVHVDIRRGARMGAQSLREFSRATRRVPLSSQHPLAAHISSLPERLRSHRHVRSTDTPENQFIKFALQGFEAFLAAMQTRLEKFSSMDSRLRLDIVNLQEQLRQSLGAEVLQSTSTLTMLPLGSPVLQRRAGYREVYQAWLRFDMAARLVWQGGDEVYSAGQRDIATLYEYWVFFKLLDIVHRVFKLEKPPAETLMESTGDEISLKLKSGEQLVFEGVTLAGDRPLRARFSYNLTFTRNDNPSEAGSWTERMRPDYTISLWPADFKSDQAEAQELMVHVHFDAKYRIDTIEQLFGRDDADLVPGARDTDLSDEKREQKLGRYQRGDLLKMHAYRDAIRRTQGAYVLYPGDMSRQWQGFHEILPGLGAFPIKPGQGAAELEKFIGDIVTHACDRATMRERQSYHLFDVQQNPVSLSVRHKLPERTPDGDRRAPPPAETYVLIGWYKSHDHLDWIKRKCLYNFRMNLNRGSLRLAPQVSSASYLLLHGDEAVTSPLLFCLDHGGPRVLSAATLTANEYPSVPTQEFYLVYDLSPAQGFDHLRWDYNKLPDRLLDQRAAEPQVTTLDVVMAAALRV